MSIPKVNMQQSSLANLMKAAKAGENAAAENAAAETSGASFGDHVNNLLESLNSKQLEADQSLANLVQGKTDNVHNVVLSVVKADMSFRMALELRNRLTEAYQEIMRMQV